MNGTFFCIYTTEIGGYWKALNCTEDEYLVWKNAKRVPTNDKKVAFMALVRVEDNMDFILGEPRVGLDDR